MCIEVLESRVQNNIVIRVLFQEEIRHKTRTVRLYVVKGHKGGCEKARTSDIDYKATLRAVCYVILGDTVGRIDGRTDGRVSLCCFLVNQSRYERTLCTLSFSTIGDTIARFARSRE